jgi:hypothetical protein
MSILYAYSCSALSYCKFVRIYCILYQYAAYEIKIIIIFHICVNILFVYFIYTIFIELLLKCIDEIIKIVFIYVGGLFFLRERFRYRYLDNV